MERRGPIVGSQLDSGWYFILDPNYKLIENADKLAKLSSGAEVLGGAIEEHCNYAMAKGWQNGRESWRVEHNLDDGADHLLVAGLPPEPFSQIRDKIVAEREATPEEQRHDFYFSIPVDLFLELTGYCYYRRSSLGDECVSLKLA